MSLRTLVLAVVAACVVGFILGAGTSARSDGELQQVRQVAREEGERAGEDGALRRAEERYADGFRAGQESGRGDFAQGTDDYRRILRRGYRKAEQEIRPQVPAAPVAQDGDYDQGHLDGYNEGYDEGYQHASSGDSYDNSDNDTPGTVGDDDQGRSGDAASEAASGDCDPNYEGACVPVDAGDVDCGEVVETDFDVVGDDVYGLDREGDGVACES